MGQLRNHIRRVGLLIWGSSFLLATALCGAGYGVMRGWLDNAPALEDFEAYNPPEATILYDRTGAPFASLFEQKRIVVDIDTLPIYVPDSFVAIEDRNFRDHFGVDPKGILRASLTNAMRGSAAQGASTITQQLARNLIGRIGRDKTVERKIKELFVALQMERNYSKDQILEVYINQIYLGSGAYGVESASRTYFGKSAAHLNLHEAATLAGLPQLPEKYSPLNNPELAEKRRDQVLSRLKEYGYIDDREFDLGLASDVETTSGTLRGAAYAPYFVDALQRDLANDPVMAGLRLSRVGWSLRTTLDRTAQDAAEAALRDTLPELEKEFFRARQERFKDEVADPKFSRTPASGQVRMATVRRVFSDSVVVELPGGWRANLPIPPATAHYLTEEAGVVQGSGIDIVVSGTDKDKRIFRGEILPRTILQGAVVVIDSKSGGVRAIAGGRSFSDRSNGGAFNRAWMARRQPGSTLKPLFYAAALERGMRPDDAIMDSPISFGNKYAPRNYENRYLYSTTVQRALEKSANAATFRVVKTVGLGESVEFLRKFQRIGSRPWVLEKYWPVVLGSSEMTPIEVAGAYQPIAFGGVARGPHLVTGVWNAGGRDTPISDGRSDEALMSEATAARLIQMMVGVMRHGTGHAAHDALPEDLQAKVGGKTGTTDDNRDAWFAGFTPYETIVAWVGFDDAIPMGPGCTGGKMAGPIWARTASAIWLARTPEEREAPLPMPEGWTLFEREDRAVAMRTADLPLPPPPQEIRFIPYSTPPPVASAYDTEGAPEEVIVETTGTEELIFDTTEAEE